MSRARFARALRRIRKGILGLDPRRAYALERRVAANERQIKDQLELLNRSSLLARECALSIEHLLQEVVRLQRDLSALRDED